MCPFKGKSMHFLLSEFLISGLEFKIINYRGQNCPQEFFLFKKILLINKFE